MANRTFDDVKVNMTLKPQNVRANLLSTQEDLAVQMGKIQKWYTDLRSEAWDGTSRNDLLVNSTFSLLQRKKGVIIRPEHIITNQLITFASLQA